MEVLGRYQTLVGNITEEVLECRAGHHGEAAHTLTCLWYHHIRKKPDTKFRPYHLISNNIRTIRVSHRIFQNSFKKLVKLRLALELKKICNTLFLSNRVSQNLLNSFDPYFHWNFN